MSGTFAASNYMFIGYLGAFLFALSQLILVLTLGISGVVNVFFQSHENKWLNRLRLIPQSIDHRQKSIGVCKVFLSLCLASPYLLGIHYFITIIVGTISIILFVFLGKQSGHKKVFSGAFNHYILILLAIIVVGATIYEQKDAIVLGNNLEVKMRKWREKEIVWQNRHDITAPKINEIATDFEITSYDRSHSVRLSDFRGKKPVALLFGSYT